jgi:D-lactate dehydrogenase
VQYVNLETLLTQADIITLHLPYHKANHHFINAERIAKMKKGVMLINTARGALVDTAAAINALDSAQLGAFGFRCI